MAHSRHQHHSDARKNRKIPRAALIAAPIATVVTLGAVGYGVLADSGGAVQDSVTTQASVGDVLGDREDQVSRSAPRATVEGPTKKQLQRMRREEAREQARREARRERQATRAAIRNASTELWTTAELNLWDDRGDDAGRHGTVEEGEQVLITGRSGNGRTEIVIDDRAWWVTSGYLDEDKPEPPEPEPEAEEESTSSSSQSQGLSTAPCSNGASASGGANVQQVLRATCAFAPEITSYGGTRPGDGGDHGAGRALDVMVSGQRGWEIAEHLRSNSSQLGISYIIYSQKIWSVDRAGEGWRSMSDRGSTTANHYDHVHVSTY